MNIILKGRDVHTNRLELALRTLNKPYITALDPSGIPNNFFDIAFIDPSFGFDVGSKLKAKKKVFYDCEDSPTDFYPGAAYNTIKCSTYVKMNYLDIPREDKLKQVGFPAYSLAGLNRAAIDLPDRNKKEGTPFFLGHPTYIGRYSTPELIINRSENYYNKYEVKTIAKTGEYNQRYDWLLSLRDHNIQSDTGIVFSSENNNLNLYWQSVNYGNVRLLEKPAIPYTQNIIKLYENGIGLSPTGHERLSWRYYDIMAAGAVLIMTDYGKQKTMYMPKEVIIVKDEEDLGPTILEVQKNFKEIYRAHQKNKEFMKILTPDKIWNDFVNSLE